MLELFEVSEVASGLLPNGGAWWERAAIRDEQGVLNGETAMIDVIKQLYERDTDTTPAP